MFSCLNNKKLKKNTFLSFFLLIVLVKIFKFNMLKSLQIISSLTKHQPI